MPTDSNGNYSLPDGYLAVTGETILPSQHNPPLEDLAAGMTARVMRNGSGPMTGNLPFAGFKITGLGNGSQSGDAVNKGQLDAAAGFWSKLVESIKTDNYTVLAADAGAGLVANKATTISFALPAVAGVSGANFPVRNIGVGDLTLDPNGTETIEGAASLVLKQGDAALISSNGTIWRAVVTRRPATTAEARAATDKLQPITPGTLDEWYDRWRGEMPVNTTGSGVNLAATDAGKLIEATAALTITLPASASVSAGFRFRFKNSSTGNITLTPNGSDTAPVPTLYPGQFGEIFLDGTAWRVLFADTPLLFVCDEKAASTAGGSFSSGAWRTRTLNSVKLNQIYGASLASNQITLPAGTYYIQAAAPAIGVNGHKAALRNVTDSTFPMFGAAAYAPDVGANDSPMTESVLEGSFTITAQKVFEIQHQCWDTRSTDGLGNSAGFGAVETYTRVLLAKIS